MRLPAWIIALPLTRIVLAVGGVALLAYGAVIAWRAEASTAILIVGAALLFLAVIGDWERARLEHGQTALEVWRHATEQLSEASDEIVEAAAQADVPEERREQLERVALELERTRDALSQISARAPSLWYATSRRVDPRLREYLSSHPEARTETTVEPARASLRLTLPRASRVGSVWCEVHTPRAGWKAAPPRVLARTRRADHKRVFEVAYPDDFPEGAPFEPGAYLVRWTADGEIVATEIFVVPGAPEE